MSMMEGHNLYTMPLHARLASFIQTIQTTKFLLIGCYIIQLLLMIVVAYCYSLNIQPIGKTLQITAVPTIKIAQGYLLAVFLFQILDAMLVYYVSRAVLDCSLLTVVT
jgi:hypothetical protein